MTISRRSLLEQLLAFGAAGAVAPMVARANGRANVPEPMATSSTNAAEDLYRKEFAATYGDGERHGYAYHCVNCQGNCAWEVWANDGKITRENQSAQYPQIAPNIPDANPRGCNKGAQHSQIVYEADRLVHPMKRVGERGEGKWKRIDWDEAIAIVATQLYDTMLERGPAGNYIHIGAGVLSEARAASVKRLGTLLGAVRPYIASTVGDMFPGVTAVYGEGNVGCTYDFLYGADLNVFWGCNPNTSRMPDAHYVWEAKYNGSKIVVVAPEFNSTAVHADLFVPVRPGYDGHLALAILERLIARRLYDGSFLSTFTDLPLLVRKDTHALLALSEIDLADRGFDARSAERFASDPVKRGEVFLAFEAKRQKLTAMPGSHGASVHSLRLDDLDWDIRPTLEGTWRVALKDGSKVEVETVFSAMRRSIGEYSAEKTHTLTGVHPAIVDELARDLSKSKVAVITMGFSIGKHFNGMLSQRAIASLAAFTGRLGPSGGLNTENEWNISGLAPLSGFDGRYRHRFASGFVSEFMLGDGFSDAAKHFSDADVFRATGESRAEYIDRAKAMVDASASDAGEHRGKPWWPETETFLLFGDARFRRNKAHYAKAFLEKARFIAYGDFRMSDFANFADVLLPCTSPYETWDLRTNPGYHRFANVCVPPAGLSPVGEAKSEWEITRLIAEKMQAIAVDLYAKTKDSRFVAIPDATHTESGVHEMDRLVEEFTAGGKLGTARQAVEFALEHVDQFKPNTTKSMIERGGFLALNAKAGKSSPLHPNRPYNTFETNRFLRQPFETLTGRLAFHVGHPLFIARGAHLPTATLPIRPERFPFLLMTPHARWSVHSTYKTSPLLQRLQRGKPYVMINPAVAEKLGIADGEDVKLSNDLGEVIMMAKLASGVPPTALVMEHGFEPFMYKKRVGHNVLAGTLLNVLEVADGHGHLSFGTNWDGNQHAYEATVNLSKV